MAKETAATGTAATIATASKITVSTVEQLAGRRPLSRARQDRSKQASFLYFSRLVPILLDISLLVVAATATAAAAAAAAVVAVVLALVTLPPSLLGEKIFCPRLCK